MFGWGEKAPHVQAHERGRLWGRLRPPLVVYFQKDYFCPPLKYLHWLLLRCVLFAFYLQDNFTSIVYTSIFTCVTGPGQKETEANCHLSSDKLHRTQTAMSDLCHCSTVPRQPNLPADKNTTAKFTILKPGRQMCLVLVFVRVCYFIYAVGREERYLLLSDDDLHIISCSCTLGNWGNYRSHRRAREAAPADRLAPWPRRHLWHLCSISGRRRRQRNSHVIWMQQVEGLCLVTAASCYIPVWLLWRDNR